MKAAKHSFRRTLAIMLSILLLMSNLGLHAYAEDSISASDNADEILAEEVFSSDAREPAQETAGESDSGEQAQQFSEDEAVEEEIGQGESDSGEDSVEELTDEAVSEESEESAEGLTGQTAEQQTEELMKDTTDKLSEEDNSELTEEPDKEQIEEPTRKFTEEPTKDRTVEPTEGPTEEPTENGIVYEMTVTDDQEITTWGELQTALIAGGTVTLTQNLTAGSEDTALTIPKGVKVTLDLNGYTLNRGLDRVVENGSVIVVNGTLTVTDGSSEQTGTITGGSTTSVGGGVRVKKNGIFTLNGGTISGNHADNNGGGVYVSGSGSRFNLLSGTITDNTSRNGGGVAQSSTGDITISGGSVTGNTATNNGGGIWYGGSNTTNFTMAGGTISGNTATEKGGGVFVNSGAFYMDGGSITNNTANNGGGVFINGGSLAGNGVNVSNNTAPTDPQIGSANGSSLTAYSVTINTTGNGTVTADQTSAIYGQKVTLTVTPDSEDDILRSLTVTTTGGDLVAVADNAFTMPRSDVTVTAEFAQRNRHFLEIDSEKVHDGYIPLDQYSYYEGDTVTVTADPYSGYITDSWVVLMRDEFGTGYNRVVPNVSHPTPNTITFPMPSADVKLYATFVGRDQFLVFAPTMAGGTVVADPNPASYDDYTVTLTIQPDNGYEYVPGTLQVAELNEDMSQGRVLSDYYFSELIENRQYSLEIFHNVIVTAEFQKAPEKIKYNILVDDDTENGTLSADYALAEAGWTIKVKAEPAPFLGYALESLSVMDTSGKAITTTELTGDEYQYQFTMPEGDVFITGTFAIPVYTVTVSNPDAETTGCDISANSESEVGFTVNVFVTLMPDKEMTSLTVTGDDTGIDYSDRLFLKSHNEGGLLYIYGFTMPEESVTITGRFAAKTYTISADEGMPGTLVVEVNGEQQDAPATAAAKDKIVLIFTPPGFYALRYLKYQYMLNGRLLTINLVLTRRDDGSYTAEFNMPGSDVMVLAELTDVPEVPYVNPDGSPAGVEVCKAVSAVDEVWNTGWYAVTEDVTVPDARITVNGNVNLILCDGAALTVPEGISVNSGSSFTVWGQTAGTGMLKVNDTESMTDTIDDNLAGIGGDNNMSSGTITINGGMIDARGGTDAAAIGGGNEGVGNVVINGGTVTARGSQYAAAIGGGRNSTATVVINGGNVTANGDTSACGIGDGNNCTGSTITLNWTNSTDSISATSYSGSITLQKAFECGSTIYSAGPVSSNDEFAAVTLRPHAAHLFADPVWEWSDYSAAELVFTCGCGERECHAATISSEPGDLFTIYTASVTVDGTTYTDKKTKFEETGEVSYVDLDGHTQTVTASLISDMSTNLVPGRYYNLEPGWYAVAADVTIDGRISLTDYNQGGGVSLGGGSIGEYNLILCDGATLTVTEGIRVDGSDALTIWGQTKGTGTLIASGTERTAGIGAYQDSSGPITINGGTISATGGSEAAGIGGGANGAGTVTINRGSITATGSDHASGIGSGGLYDGYGLGAKAQVVINGGNVKAIGGEDGNGIGGYTADGSSISLGWKDYDNDSITADSYSGTVTLTRDFTDGTNMYAAGPVDNTSINGKKLTPAVLYTITFVPGAGSGTEFTSSVRQGESVVLPDCGFTAPIGASFAGWKIGEQTLQPETSYTPTASITATALWEMPYVDAQGNDMTPISAYTVIDTTTKTLSGNINGGWYVAIGDINIADRVKVSGSVNLILCDGAHLRPYGGITVQEGSSLTIWQQKGDHRGALIIDNTGSVKVTDDFAALGASSSYYGLGTITINGGSITVIGGKYGAGIGGARNESVSVGSTGGGTIVINGGIVRATGGQYGAGIGGGDHWGVVTVTINGGDVTATGGTYSAGIGGGRYGNGGTITITGGDVVGTGSNQAAGIGGGEISAGGTITITGGQVIGQNYNKRAGIGDSSSYYGENKAAITLDWTDTTKDTMSVYSDSYNGMVTLRNSFTDGEAVYSPGTADNAALAKKTLWPSQESSNITVVFDSDGGSEVAAQSVPAGAKAEKPEDPSKEGYTFMGWYQVTGTDPEETLAETPFDFVNTAITVDITLKAVWKMIPRVTINGVTGSFNDKIKLNYYFDIPAEVLADENAYVTLTNEDTGNTVTLLIKEAENVTGKGYKFSIPLAAKEASDTITARVSDGRDNALNIVGSSGTDYSETGVQYTLMEYFTWLESTRSGGEKAVGAAAKDYCIAAQIYFDYHDDGLAVSSEVNNVTAEMLSGYIAGREGTLPAGVSIRGISAMLESDNTLRLYLGFTEADPSDLNYAIDGDPVDLKQRSDGSYYLAMDAGVWSNRLQDAHTYSISDGTNTYTITASVLTYARSCAIKSNEKDSSLGKALYLYNKAAVAEFGE